MSKKTESRLTPYEKDIYNKGQSLIKQGREKMEQARKLADERAMRSVEEAERLASAAHSAKLIADRNERFKENIEVFLDDVRRTCPAYHLELGIWDSDSEFDFDAPFCKVTLTFRPKV